MASFAQRQLALRHVLVTGLGETELARRYAHPVRGEETWACCSASGPATT